MKKVIVSFLALVLGVFISPSIQAQKQKEKSLLWKVTGNGLEKASYLYGTIHIICPDDFTMADEVKEAFKATEVTVLELDMDDPDMAKNMQMNSVNPGMANVSDQLSEEELGLVDEFLSKNYGVTMAQMGVVKPFALMSMVLNKVVTCTPESYEGAFVKMSAEAKKEVQGLETVAFQFGLFDDVPVKEQLGLVVDMVEDMDRQIEEFNEMIVSYKAKNLPQLYKQVTKSKEFKDYLDVMLNDRNKDWIPKLEKIMKEQPAFIAVGAAHLPAKDGVINLLRAKGYQVTPVLY